MPKMKFNTRIKYNDRIHKALESFDVDEKDVAEMQAKGGVTVVAAGAERKSEKTAATEPDRETDATETPETPQKRGKKKAAGE